MGGCWSCELVVYVVCKKSVVFCKGCCVFLYLGFYVRMSVWGWGMIDFLLCVCRF